MSRSPSPLPTPSPSQTTPHERKRVNWDTAAQNPDLERSSSTHSSRNSDEHHSPHSAGPHRDRSGTLPAAPRPSSISKPALRSSHQSGRNSPNADDVEEINELDIKLKSAADAQQRALKMHKGAETTGTHHHHHHDHHDSGVRERKRGRSKQRRHSHFDLFHDGSNAHTHPGKLTPTHSAREDYVPRPEKYRVGGLSAITLLHKTSTVDSSRSTSRASSPDSLSDSSYDSSSTRAHSPISAGNSIHASKSHSNDRHPRSPGQGPKVPNLSDTLTKMSHTLIKPSAKIIRKKEIRKHVQETHLRRQYIIKFGYYCMQYGAPPHRLEALMMMTSRILEIEAQFLHLAGCLIVSFDDSVTHTAEVHLVKAPGGVDLGRMMDIYGVYKRVVHDDIGVDEATQKLDEIGARPDKFKLWFMLLLHGIASMAVGPWAFSAQWKDLPIAFLLGLILGFLRLIWAPKTEMWTNVFEIVAVFFTSFLSRAFGSINGGATFCFSNLAQSSIALILPGYIVLCAAQELQSHSLVSGSVRMVYAFIYSLTIGFSLTVGTVVYGVIDTRATQDVTCRKPIAQVWYVLFMPIFALCLCFINQAKWKQMPVMMFISCVGYIVSFYSAKRFNQNSQISSTIAAFAISAMANIYSRMGIYIDQGVYNMYQFIHDKVLRRRVVRPDSEVQDLENKAVEVLIQETHLARFLNAIRHAIEHQPPKPPPVAVAAPDGTTILVQPQQDTGATDLAQEKKFAAQDTKITETITEKSVEHSSSSTDSREQNGVNTSQDPVPPPMSLPTSNNDHNEPPTPPVNSDPTTDRPNLHKRHFSEDKESFRKRTGYTLAAAAMLPAIFVLVPGGLSSTGSVVAGIQTSNNINGNSSVIAGPLTGSQIRNGDASDSNLSFGVGFSIIQIAIGLTVGIFFGNALLYPTGKVPVKKSKGFFASMWQDIKSK